MEKLLTFPDPRLDGKEGIFSLDGRRHGSTPLVLPAQLVGDIMAVGDDFSVARLREAYSLGIFPWPSAEWNKPTYWHCPRLRGVLDIADLHLPRSLAKFMAKSSWTWSVDRAFDAVIHGCATAPRGSGAKSWISPKVRDAYRDFHRAGHAHSVEVWDGNELVGGLYGVYVAGVFCGESMFHRQSNASKFAFVKLVEFLQVNAQTWIDTEMVTSMIRQFGGKYIPRSEFLDRLETARRENRSIAFRK